MASPLNQLWDLAPNRKVVRRHMRRLERVSLRHAHKFVVERFTNLRAVQRHAGGWLFIVTVLSLVSFWQVGVASNQYNTLIPAEGGVYTEGVFGTMDSLNPLFAATPAERSAAKLLFASLLTYDEKNDLVGELADYWKVENDGKTYTIHIRPNARWDDGTKLTVDDVLFTFNLIKNADAKSPLYASWRNIGVEKVDAQNVRFILPTSYAGFTDSLTVGILPEGLLKKYNASELRTIPFNRAPQVSSGPFSFISLTNASAGSNKSNYVLQMRANNNFVLGQPKVASFQLHTYGDREDLPKAFRSKEIASFSDTSYSSVKDLGDASGYTRASNPLFNGVYAFLKMDAPVLSDLKVRQALELSTDKAAITKMFDSQVMGLDGPLLPGQIGYRDDVHQAARDQAKARQLLDDAGWKLGANGKRQKDGQLLQLNLVTVSNGDYAAIAQSLTDEWSKLGITFNSQIVKPEDVQQNFILGRSYDILIYEIAIGKDPDVYAYWHSSQANERGLNLSNYKSAKVDDALDSARATNDPKLREAKYRFFIQQWINDVPAIGLYRSTLEYAQNNNVVTFKNRPLVDATDRYFNVQDWAAGREMGRVTR